MTAQATAVPADAPREPSGWAPLSHPAFRRLWTAQFVSNIGSWMQTVAAQWVMTSLTTSALLLSAISAAGSIPVLLLAIPAGALALLFVIGIGGAASAPTWQTLTPELVPAPERPQAIALGSVNQNLARAVGPAIGGALLAATSAGLVFGVNAVSFLAVVGAVAGTAIPIRTLTLPREHVFAAVRAGGRYVVHSPILLALIVRAALFIFPAGALWALLPLVARFRLGLGSAGYGLLLGCVGVGALVAASLGPQLRRRVAPRVVYALACLLVAGPALLLAVTHSVAVALVVVPVTWRLAFPAVLGAGPLSEEPLALPEITDVQEGPVAITVSYRLAPGQADAFLALGEELRRTRRRTGAVRWHLHRDLEDTDLFDEVFIVGSWEEHERQHARMQGPDRQVLDAIDALLAPGEHRTARHALAIRPPRRPRR
ncbi:MAG TPA: MFS transporter [Solirubrobacteraceae bacterium]|nr:MFS transporter [Solirubrobacteraceae bacterium]